MAAVGGAAQVRLTWPVIYSLAERLPCGRIYGIPRGGAIVAGAMLAMDLPARLRGDPRWELAETPGDADYLVDDIIDSGATAARWEERYGLTVRALIDKRRPGECRNWVVFPWEGRDETAGPTDAVRRLLEHLGEDPCREGLVHTPERYLKALQELAGPDGKSEAEILSADFDGNGYDQMVVVRAVPFVSLCEHHLLPFFGAADMGYVPVERVVGLSKLPRLLRHYARRLQIQERLTQQVAQALEVQLAPLGVGVVLRATHTCMAFRGACSQGEMVTSDLRGVLREGKARWEFLALCHR